MAVTVLRVRLNKDRLITHLRRDHSSTTQGTDSERRRWHMSELSALHQLAHLSLGKSADHEHVR